MLGVVIAAGMGRPFLQGWCRMNEMQIEKYQSGNKGFEVVGGNSSPKIDCWDFEKVIADNRWNINITVRGASESELHLFDLHEDALDDLRSAHNTDMQALRDQLKQSSELIEMQARRIAELNQQVAELADIAKELSTELDVFAHTRGDDLSLIRLTQTADIIIAKAKGDPIPDFGVDTVYPCDACCDGYAKVGDCCNECGVVLVLPGRAI